MNALVRSLAVTAVFGVASVSGCTQARASPAKDVSIDRDAARTSALDNRAKRMEIAGNPSTSDTGVTSDYYGIGDNDARAAVALASFKETPATTPSEVAAAAGCSSGTLLWRRDQDVELCAFPCAVDTDCASGERCRVIDLFESGPVSTETAADRGDAADDGPGTLRLCDPFWQETGSATSTGK